MNQLENEMQRAEEQRAKMQKIWDLDAQLTNAAFLQQENSQKHHTYRDELLLHNYICQGDFRSLLETWKLQSSQNGVLSKNRLTNLRYLFVTSCATITRACIESGMDEQEAYNRSNLFIQRMDACQTAIQIEELHTFMIFDYTKKMAEIKQFRQQYLPDYSNVGIHYSTPVKKCLDYIYFHLHARITLDDLAKEAALSKYYLAKQFKQETGMTVQKYISSQKINSAKNMLLHSDYSITEIGLFLSFSSASHFVRVFKEYTGITPRQFRQNSAL